MQWQICNKRQWLMALMCLHVSNMINLNICEGKGEGRKRREMEERSRKGEEEEGWLTLMLNCNRAKAGPAGIVTVAEWLQI